MVFIKPICFTLLLMVAIYILAIINAYTIDDEDRLRTNLFQSYNKDIRPPYNQSTALQININFVLTAINDMNDAMGLMTSVGVFDLTWNDDRLVWNSSEYSGLSDILVRGDVVWSPTLFVFNSIDLKSVNRGNIMSRIYNNGTVDSLIGIKLITYYDSQMTYFPFDTQTCKIITYVYGYPTSDVSLHSVSERVPTWSYSDNSGWALIDTSARPSCVGDYCIVVEFELTLKRRHLYFSVSMLAPIIILSAVNPTVFLMPIDSGERVSFSVTMLLSFGVFLSEISNHMPEVSDPMAYLSYYILFSIIGSASTSILTIITTNMYYKTSTKPIPTWLRALLAVLSLRIIKNICVCCKKRSKSTEENNAEPEKALGDTATDEKTQQDISWKDAAEEMNFIAAVYSVVAVLILQIGTMLIIYFGQ